MDSKMIKGCVAGLLLAVSGFANAGLVNYDITFRGGNANASVEGVGHIVADSDLEAIVSYRMYTTSATPDFAFAFSWDGVSAMFPTTRYFNIADLLHVNSFSTLNSLNGSYLTVDNEFTIWGLPSERYAHRLDDHRPGEFFSFVDFQDKHNSRLNLHVRITKNVPEPSTLAIFALGLLGLASRRFKKQA